MFRSILFGAVLDVESVLRCLVYIPRCIVCFEYTLCARLGVPRRSCVLVKMFVWSSVVMAWLIDGMAGLAAL